MAQAMSSSSTLGITAAGIHALIAALGGRTTALRRLTIADALPMLKECTRVQQTSVLGLLPPQFALPFHIFVIVPPTAKFLRALDVILTWNKIRSVAETGELAFYVECVCENLWAAPTGTMSPAEADKRVNAVCRLIQEAGVVLTLTPMPWSHLLCHAPCVWRLFWAKETHAPPEIANCDEDNSFEDWMSRLEADPIAAAREAVDIINFASAQGASPEEYAAMLRKLGDASTFQLDVLVKDVMFNLSQMFVTRAMKPMSEDARLQSPLMLGYAKLRALQYRYAEAVADLRRIHAACVRTMGPLGAHTQDAVATTVWVLNTMEAHIAAYGAVMPNHDPRAAVRRGVLNAMCDHFLATRAKFEVDELPTISATLSVSNMYARLGLLPAAAAAHGVAARGLTSVLGAWHPRTVQAVARHARLLVAMNRVADAVQAALAALDARGPWASTGGAACSAASVSSTVAAVDVEVE